MFSFLRTSALLAGESVWEELWAYIKDNWFTVDINQYEHLSLSNEGIVTIRMVVLGICIGIFLATIASAFDRRKYGGFVRKLIRDGCTDPQNAKTLEELGYRRSAAIRGNLRSGHILRKFVRCVGEEAYWNAQRDQEARERMPRYPMNFDTDRFYIDKENTYAAEVKFDKTGTEWRTFLFVFIGCIVLALFICFIIPEMLQLLDNFIGLFV